MHIVYLAQDAAYELTVDVDGTEARVGDLAGVLGHRGDRGSTGVGLFIDGVHRSADTLLTESGLHEGALVSAAASSPDDPSPSHWSPGIYVTVISGIEAGRCVPIPVEGDYTVGRSPDCHVSLADPTLSRVHCTLGISPEGSVTVTNQSQHKATRVAGTAVSTPLTVPFGTPIRLDTVTLTVAYLGHDDQIVGADRPAGSGGTVSVNRPPRSALPSSSVLPAPPEAPDNAGKAPFSLAMLVAPAVMGLAMVLVFHNLFFAMFALMSPIMVVGNWWESKHRSKKNLRSSTREYAKQLESFQEATETGYKQEIYVRRRFVPTIAEIRRRALLPSVWLWERRPQHPDFLHLSLGTADSRWSPEFASRTSQKGPSKEVSDILEANSMLPDVPAVTDLSEGGVVGIVGHRQLALALARSLLCQAAVMHGPADLSIAVAVADDPGRVWDWAKWLPHTKLQTSGADRRLLAVGFEDTEELFEALILDAGGKDKSGLSFGSKEATDKPTTLYVVDGDDLLTGRGAPARRVMAGEAGPAAGIVVAPSVDRLPSFCSDVVVVEETGEAMVSPMRKGGESYPICASPLNPVAAREIAVALARFDDPELHIAGASLPSVIRLGAMLGVKDWSPEVVRRRWANAGNKRTHLRAAIGNAESGRFELDLDRHGPHGLIGGTTGSGKSELLKTLVASLAATYPPDQLTFGLFDFKGGATFTDFANIPHTVGMASDLDVNLAKRALRCLRAELLYREHVFDAAGVKDLAELNERQLAGDSTALSVEVLPRLVVIIDEFAAMAKELSEEIGSLADLTARGRSLGVHLLLATQKPSTAVNAEIRTNTRLRISLQVEDKQDSLDVVGIPDAATINHKGRGYFRVGSSEVLPLQTAWSTSKVITKGGATLTVQSFPFAVAPPPAPQPKTSNTATELHRLVRSINDANAAAGIPPQRKPWPEPLPDVLTLDELGEMAIDPAVPRDDVYFALADDPDRQTRYPVGWPMRSGNMIFYGVVGSGTTTALESVGLAFVEGYSPEQRQLYVIDGGAGDLAPLAGLPHCGAVVRGAEEERQIRLFRMLMEEVDRRRSLSPAERASLPTILLLFDNVESFRSIFEQKTGPTWSQFLRVFADGPEAGVYSALTATRVSGLPGALTAATPNKVMLRLADITDYGMVGVTKSAVPTFVPGRALRSDSSVMQIAMPGPDLEEAVAKAAAGFEMTGADSSLLPRTIQALPDSVPVHELAGASKILTDRWDLAVGRRDDDFDLAVLSLYDGEHAFVLGPARSGKSTALLTLAASAREAGPNTRILGYASRRSPLHNSHLLDECTTEAKRAAEMADAAMVDSTPTLFLVDDAEMVDDPGTSFTTLVSSERPDLHIAASGKPDVLRSMYGHWTQTARRSRAGLLLQPALDRDGDMLGARLPLRLHVPLTAGRGFLVANGDAVLMQTAQ